MTKKVVLTDKFVAKLKATGVRQSYQDTLCPGLFLNVGAGGKRSFALFKRPPGEKNPTTMTLGQYGQLTLADARSKARAWIELLSQGKNPVVEAQRTAAAQAAAERNSFALVAADFIAEKVATERKAKEVEAEINRVLIPAFGDRPITEITTLEIRDLIKRAKSRGDYAAHNLLILVRRLFGWAFDQHCYGLTASPSDRLKPKALIGKKEARKRILSDAEIRGLWTATDKLGYPLGPFYKMLLLTGQRRREVAGMRWSEIDLNARIWIVPASRMKMADAHIVPLSPDVVELLRSLPRFVGGDCVFSHKGGRSAINGFAVAKKRLDSLIGGEVDWCVHDLRRTMRTRLGGIAGVSTLTAELVIAHTKRGVLATYDLYSYLPEKRHALDSWAALLRNILEPRTDNVTPLRAGAGTF